MFDSIVGFIQAHQVAFAFAALPILAYITVASLWGGMMRMKKGLTEEQHGITSFGIALFVVSALPGSFFFILFDVLPSLSENPVRLFAVFVSLVVVVLGWIHGAIDCESA